MTSYWFPDTTVFRNFEAGERLEWLKEFLKERGRWTEVIETEVRNSLGRHPRLAVVFDEGWIPNAEQARDDGESMQIDAFRRAAMGGLPDLPTQHLGESETFIIMRNRPAFSDSCFITDDRDAYDLFRRQGVKTMHSLDILKHLVAQSECSPIDAFTFYEKSWLAERNFLDRPIDALYFE